MHVKTGVWYGALHFGVFFVIILEFITLAVLHNLPGKNNKKVTKYKNILTVVICMCLTLQFILPSFYYLAK